jgi:hypothetical protein
MLLSRVVSQPEDFRTALDAARRETDPDLRGDILNEMSGGGLRAIAAKADAAAYVELLRRDFNSEKSYLAPALAKWSRDRADLDLILHRLEHSPDLPLVRALSGRHLLVKGRQAECRDALVRLITNRSLRRDLRSMTLSTLRTLGPWDDDTKAAVRRLREEGK